MTRLYTQCHISALGNEPLSFPSFYVSIDGVLMFLAKYAKGPCCIYDEQRVFSNEIIQEALNYSEDREQMLEKP